MAAAVGVEGGWRALRSSPPGPLSARLGQLLLLVLVVAAAGGLGLLVGGAGPREGLHFLYALLALAALPLADSFSQRARPRVRGMVTLVGGLVVLVVIVRLFQTG